MNNPPFLLPEKKCSICKQLKKREEFYPRNDRKSGISAQCRKCEKNRKASYMKEYRNRDLEKTRQRDRDWRKKNPDRVRNMNLKKVYGIDNSEYDRMLIAQNYECKICKTKHQPHSRESRLHIDHCHSKGHIRALLCTQCNKGLGHFRDRTDLLAKAIEYLKAFS